MKKLMILMSLLLASALSFAGNTITWQWVDSTDAAATYSIYQVQVGGATASTVCPANPVYTLLKSGIPAGSTSYSQIGTTGTLFCSVATATDPTSGLESVFSNQAQVFLPPAPPPPTSFSGSHN